MTTEHQSEGITLIRMQPRAAIEGGRVVIACRHLDVGAFGGARLRIGGVVTRPDFVRDELLIARVPVGAMSGTVTLETNGQVSNGVPCEIGSRMAQNLHPVSNPAIDDMGNLFVTLSGSRGQKVPVSIYKISPRGILTPFVQDIVNPTGMAFGPDGQLYVSSRFDGKVYRVSAEGTWSVFAHDLGVATGVAFGPQGYLYVGDRDGTIYQVNQQGTPSAFASLAPSVAAFHLAFDHQGNLYATNPSMSGYDAIHRITPEGEVQTFAADLGRPQGMAFDAEDNLYVVAYDRGNAGILKITPPGEMHHVVSGVNLVGLALDAMGHLLVVSTSAVYRLNRDAIEQAQP
jgi:sugar lactone lactonase YvrE